MNSAPARRIIRITVTETEYAIRLPSTTLTPGTYTFAVDNTGNAPHDLVVKGPGVDSARTPVLQKRWLG